MGVVAKARAMNVVSRWVSWTLDGMDEATDSSFYNPFTATITGVIKLPRLEE